MPDTLDAVPDVRRFMSHPPWSIPVATTSRARRGEPVQKRGFTLTARVGASFSDFERRFRPAGRVWFQDTPFRANSQRMWEENVSSVFSFQCSVFSNSRRIRVF